MTTTDVAVRDQGAALALVPTAPEQITAALEQWVGGMAASVRGAEYIVDTPMCPDAFWPLPAGVKSKAPKQMLPNEERESYLARRQVATYTLGSVVRYGLQLGLPPEVAVQGIFTVGGRMSMYAEQMVALVKSRGHGHRVIERSRERCVVEVRRAGDTEWKRFEYTIEDAIAAGYVPGKGPNANLGTWPDGKPKTGGNEKYNTDAPAMLYARCSSIACRTEFPDVLRGLVTAEEMQDEQRSAPVEVHAEVVERPTPKATAAAILAAAVPAEQPAAPAPVPATAPVEASAPVDPAPVAEAPQQPAEEPDTAISEGQWRAINARLLDLGVKGDGQKAARAAVIRAILDAPDLAIAAMTSRQAAFVLDQLADPTGPKVVADVLGWGQAEAEQDAERAIGESHAAAEAEQSYVGEPAGWELDGAEAAAEGR